MDAFAEDKTAAFEEVAEKPAVSLSETKMQQQASLAVLASGDFSLYPTVLNDLETSGSSTYIENIKADNFAQNNLAITQIVNDGLSSKIMTPEETSDLLLAANEQMDRVPSTLDLKEAVALKNVLPTADKLPVILRDALKLQSARNAAAHAVNKHEDAFGSFFEGTEAIGEMFVPLVDTVYSNKLAYELGLGVNSAFTYSAVDKAREYIRDKNVSTEEQLRRIDLVKNTLMEYGTLNDNSLIVESLSSKIFGDYNNIDRAIDTVTDMLSLVDLAVIGKGISALRMGSRVPDLDSPLETVNTSNKELATELQRLAVDNEPTAKALTGVDSSSVFEYYNMPKYVDDIENLIKTEGADSAIYQEYLRQKREADSIFSSSDNLHGIQMSKEDRDANLAAAKQRFENSPLVYVDVANSFYKHSGDDINMDVVIRVLDKEKTVKGQTKSKLFSTYDDALNKTKAAYGDYGISDDNITIYKVNTDGSLSKASKGEEGFFITEVSRKQKYNHKDVSAYSDSDFGFVLNKWLVDPINRFSRGIVDGVTRSFDKAGNIEKRLLADAEQNIGKLSDKEKEKVFNVLETGANASKSYSVQELRDIYRLTDKEITAVMTNYRLWDTLWRIDNRSYARRLAEQNTHILSSKSGTYFTSGGKIDIARVQEKNMKVLDPDTGNITTFKTDELKGKGIDVARLRTNLKHFDEDADFVVINKGAQFRQVREDDVVLNRTQGYFRRTYKGDFFIEKFKRTGTGERVSVEVVANTNNSKKAQEFVNNANASKTKDADIFYSVRASRELMSQLEDNGSAFETLYRGRTIERHRGKHLAEIEDLDALVNGKAEIMNPLESMVQAAVSTARYSQVRNQTDLMKNKFMKTFADMLDNPNVFPKDVGDIKAVSGKRYENAKALFNYIKELEFTADKSMITSAWTNVFDKAARYADNVGLDGIANITRGIRDIDPISLSRSTAFVVFIATDALKFLLLNMSSLAQMSTLTLKYANPLSTIRDTVLLRSAVMDGSKFSDETYKTFAKASGISVDDAKALVDSYRNSGIFEGVDRNTMIRNGVVSIGEEFIKNASRRYVAKTKRAAGAPIELTKKYGFNLGEEINLTGTYLVAAERYSKKAKKSMSSLSGKDWEKIAADAQYLALSMRQEHRFGYQNGIPSLPTQFLQVLHKSLLLQVTGNKVLTIEERLKLAAFNMTFFGGSAYLGISSVLDQFRDTENPDAPVNVVINQLNKGALNSVLNSVGDFAVKATTGKDEESNVSFAEMYSPYSGLGQTGADLLTKVLQGNLENIADVAPSFAAMSRVVEGLDTVFNALTGVGGAELQIDPIVYAKTLTSIFSGGNTFWQTAAAVESHRLITAGTDRGDVTTFEAYSLAIGGKPSWYKDFWDINNDVKQKEAQVRELAKINYNQVKRIMASSSLGSTMPTDIKLQLMSINKFTSTLNEYEKHIYYQELNKVAKMDSKSDVKNSFAYLLVQAYLRGHVTKEELQSQIDKQGFEQLKPFLKD